MFRVLGFRVLGFRIEQFELRVWVTGIAYMVEASNFRACV